MANVLKLIIPILDDIFELKDFSEESGFIDAYLENINKPYLDNHIFLLYDGNLDTAEKLERDCKIRKSKYLYSRETIRINNKYYLLYTFINTSKYILKLREGILPAGEKDFMKIILFWQLKDGFINSLIYDRRRSFETKGIIVPEQDYVPEPFSELNAII